MVEPSQFSEVYTSINDVITHSFSNIEGLCKHAFHIHRFHVHKVKTLNKYLEILTKQKESINSNLEAIQEAFDNIDSGIVLYVHNMEKVKTELAKLADLQQDELDESKKLYGNDNEVKKLEPIIKTGDSEMVEEIDKIIDYIDRF